MAGFDQEDDMRTIVRTKSDLIDEGSSDSEFSLENDKDTTEQDIQDNDVQQGNNVQEQGEPKGNVPLPSGANTPFSKSKGKATLKEGNPNPNVKTGLARQRRQMHALPAPNSDHRHRAVSLYRREGRVERLKQPAKLFKSPSIMLTNGLDQDSVMKRLSKAWGHNAGPGPLWEMVEDRSWFKEAETIGKGGDTEAERRPLVHQNVRVKNSWKVLTEEYVRSFYCDRQNSCIYPHSFQGCSPVLAH